MLYVSFFGLLIHDESKLGIKQEAVQPLPSENSSLLPLDDANFLKLRENGFKFDLVLFFT
eukprot:c34864_g1_i1 orf=371-550(-)